MTLPQGSHDTSGQHLFLGFQGTAWTETLRARLRALRPGGLVLFRRNIQDAEQLTDLIRQADAWARTELGRGLVWAVDEEGGTVQRLAAILGPVPAALDLAEKGEDAVRCFVAETARGLRRLGIQVNFAPVLDVAEQPHCHFLGSRILGKDPETTARLGAVWIQTLQENGIVATAKHFPGLGAARLDPHHRLPVLDEDCAEKAQRSLFPFREAVRCGVRAVMTSHAVYRFWDPHWPGTLSVKINKELLRNAWGFNGVLFSDDLDMKAVGGRYEPETIVRQCLLATVDGLLVCQDEHSAEILARALRDGIRRHGDLQEAHRRSVDRLRALSSSFF